MKVFKFGGASVKNALGVKNLLSVIKTVGHKDTLVVVETSIKDNYTKPSKLKIINKKKYGKTDLSFFVLS